jgi:TP901 family phage tail tape measure protein
LENVGVTFIINAEIDRFKANFKKVGEDVVASQKELQRSVKKVTELSQKYPDGFKASLVAAKALDAELTKISKQKTPYTIDQKTEVKAAAAQYAAATRSDAAAIYRAEANAVKEAEKAVIRAAREKEKAEKAAAKAQEEHHANLVKARYALYDVSAEARRVGLVMTGLSVIILKVSADFERAFVDVARTTGLVGTELESMRQSLLDVSQTTPIAFADVAKIATLGAQMNVANSNLVGFSETVAKFGAVTGVSIDESASAFGRLDQQFAGVQGNYEKLGSSILYAGRNAIATEAEITTLTTQISASAAQAGYSAEQTIGLATALASLKVAPEQARGVILRLFGDFDRMVSDGGQKLKDYATLMGITSQEAANLWKSDAPAFLDKFTAALKSSSTSAEDMNVKLGALGIVETREINVLQRLASNHDVLTRSMNDATSAYAKGTDLGNQYGQVAQTLTERINKLVNNLMAFMASAGDFWNRIIGPIIDGLSALADGITSSPLLTFLSSLAIGVAAAAGFFLLYQAALYQAAAGVLALRTTTTELININGTAAVSFKVLTGMVRELVPATNAATISTKLYGSTMAEVGVRATQAKGMLLGLSSAIKSNIILLAASAAAWVIYERFTSEAEDQQAALVKEIEKSSKAIDFQASKISLLKAQDKKDVFGNVIASTSQLTAALTAVKSMSSGIILDFITGGQGNLAKQSETVKALDEAMTNLVGSGNMTEAAKLFAEASSQASALGYTTEDLTKMFPLYSDAVAAAGPNLVELNDAQLLASESGTELAGVIKERLTGSLTTSQNAYANYASAVKTFMTDLNESGGSISAWSDTGSQALSSFSGLLDAIIQQSGNDMKGALTQTAAAIALIESKGGDASSQVKGLVERINSLYGLQLDPTTINSMGDLETAIRNVGGVADTTRTEILAMVSGGEYADVYDEIFQAIQDSVSDGGDAVKAEVTSIFDYVSELSGLFGDITDQTYRLTEAQDDYSNGWDDTRDAVKKTKKEVANLKLEVLNLKSSGKDLENQLSIAKAYGDADQIMRIQAEIAANNQKIAETEREITAANEERNMSLKGGSQSARENRSEIRARVEDASALVAAYASTAKANGKLPTPSEVQSYANTIATQFRNQATAIGFSASELEQYITTIQGFGSAAANVEPPTIDVTLNPIDTAVQAYLDKKKSTDVTITPKGDGLAEKIQKILDGAKLDANVTAQITVGTTELKKMRDRFTKGSSMWGYYNNLYNQAYAELQSQYSTSSMNRHADGGLITGPGTSRSDSIPSLLSNGEYVIQASAVNRYGVDFLNSINQQRGVPVARSPISSGSTNSGPQVVYLSVQDRELLQSALNRPVSLYTSDRVIAQSANNGNKELARRGATS